MVSADATSQGLSHKAVHALVPVHHEYIVGTWVVALLFFDREHPVQSAEHIDFPRSDAES